MVWVSQTCKKTWGEWTFSFTNVPDLGHAVLFSLMSSLRAPHIFVGFFSQNTPCFLSCLLSEHPMSSRKPGPGGTLSALRGRETVSLCRSLTVLSEHPISSRIRGPGNTLSALRYLPISSRIPGPVAARDCERAPRLLSCLLSYAPHLL